MKRGVPARRVAQSAVGSPGRGRRLRSPGRKERDRDRQRSLARRSVLVRDSYRNSIGLVSADSRVFRCCWRETRIDAKAIGNYMLLAYIVEHRPEVPMACVPQGFVDQAAETKRLREVEPLYTWFWYLGPTEKNCSTCWSACATLAWPHQAALIPGFIRYLETVHRYPCRVNFGLVAPYMRDLYDSGRIYKRARTSPKESVAAVPDDDCRYGPDVFRMVVLP